MFPGGSVMWGLAPLPDEEENEEGTEGLGSSSYLPKAKESSLGVGEVPLCRVITVLRALRCREGCPDAERLSASRITQVVGGRAGSLGRLGVSHGLLSRNQRPPGRGVESRGQGPSPLHGSGRPVLPSWLPGDAFCFLPGVPLWSHPGWN